ncbi:hypothetical protein DFJ43DRAFT_1172264 [Lentinula guzmanii]|uniref:Uncharacterized protein n=1 Tax=Lentinula guzmanii TaxID=2804957 RepID=A0AA38J164_9AGAR|nr:hypothetical protein DFJ43DRAFT_1172264 [Lentinula guzmanii]
MFIPYTERDTQLNPTGTNWLQDRIVAFQRQRSPLSYAVRQAVVKFNDQMTDADKKTVVKHFIPWIRQLAANIVTHGDQNGRGMTRAQSIFEVGNSGLDVGHEIGDALPVMYEEYIPGEDEWFLPYAGGNVWMSPGFSSFSISVEHHRNADVKTRARNFRSSIQVSCSASDSSKIRLLEGTTTLGVSTHRTKQSYSISGSKAGLCRFRIKAQSSQCTSQRKEFQQVFWLTHNVRSILRAGQANVSHKYAVALRHDNEGSMDGKRSDERDRQADNGQALCSLDQDLSTTCYLNWLMDKLGMDENLQIKLKRPTSPPEYDQLSYDEWFSWAMDTICDWPKNLFQGPSAGDGGGTRVDLPAQVGTTPALKQRVQEAREELAMYIKGLSVEPNIGNDPPKTYEIYVPGPEEYYIP